ncbi:EPIDERMAL PATTERNING FACTOR-like protein 2 [Juglans microcarpa x Juglans regia]|uniref:EPIDERMAL PATTERNING FACTOR-like protein 2 n=1 Tax=Juglans microcarpa x Juglans regia TaxID=2249226 RepID=UPI001B7DCB64|nr:EPIDERMAL PATTERNING FACTOR-like protein 2 [Juglans microcarpa x Juglans regia]
MGCSQNFICSCRLCYFAISILFLILSSTQLRSTMAEGRALSEPFSQTEREGKAILRGRRIGSRPPRCERRCNSCGHCEAILVPANPQLQNGNKDHFSRVSNFAYSRGDDTSNYKPMSWKCKCGNLIFNP